AAAAPKPPPAPQPVTPSRAPAAASAKPAPPAKPAAPVRSAPPRPKPPPPPLEEEILELTPDAAPEQPRRMPEKGGGTGKCVVVVLVLLFLFCGGVVGAGALVGVYFLHHAQQFVAQATVHANIPATSGPASPVRPEGRPPESAREEFKPPPHRE